MTYLTGIQESNLYTGRSGTQVSPNKSKKKKKGVVQCRVVKHIIGEADSIIKTPLITIFYRDRMHCVSAVQHDHLIQAISRQWSIRNHGSPRDTAS